MAYQATVEAEALHLFIFDEDPGPREVLPWDPKPCGQRFPSVEVNLHSHEGPEHLSLDNGIFHFTNYGGLGCYWDILLLNIIISYEVE